MTIQRKSPPVCAVHPGEVLREEFMKPIGLSSYALAKALHVPAPRINDIVLERRAVSPDTALRLARYFGTSEKIWMNLQSAFDLENERKSKRKELGKIRPRREVVA